MASDLHAALLREIGPAPDTAELAALRAVVELHAPREDSFAARTWLDCTGCDYREEPADWPCRTILAIALELGVSE